MAKTVEFLPIIIYSFSIQPPRSGIGSSASRCEIRNQASGGGRGEKSCRGSGSGVGILQRFVLRGMELVGWVKAF